MFGLLCAFPIWVWMLALCLMAGEWAIAFCCFLGLALNSTLIALVMGRRR